MNRRALLLGAGAAGLVAALPRAAAADGSTLHGRAFGTRWRVVLASASEPDLRHEIEAILDAVDGSMNPFRPLSEISRFNRSQAAGWHGVSQPFAHVAGAALDCAAETAGAFDPTVGPAANRFGFGPIEGTRVGAFRELAAGSGAIHKSDGSLSLDLCAIAKGYAVDRVAAHLADRGHADFLVEIGGDLRASGRSPAGRPWQLGIEDPLRGGVAHLVRLDAEALATSGDAVNSYTLAGRRYGHLIDPATARPVANDVASVSVIAPDATRADALATALLVMGPERGLAFANARAIPALFLLREKETLVSRANAPFAARLLT
ncbi:FAD:protein FMN transferase [Aureimonas mangrovi]|uniref:FAD:protein FMN transferase n=1 Tax=Aureimonas mangrovi TaxID=2758041 RepID=UPI00163DDD4A|nr:FAD:protein FMN transferase [Aureimonas mangrovi]